MVLHDVYVSPSGSLHNGILLSHKKSRIMPVVAVWIDLKIIILSEVSQRILCLNNHMVISHRITGSSSC